MSWDWLTAEWVIPAANLGTFLVALCTAITAVISILQAKKMIEQNEVQRTQDFAQMVKSQERQEEKNRLTAESVKQQAISAQLQRESLDRATRPIMSVRLLPPAEPKYPLELEVSNVGRSTAFRVGVSFDTPLPEGSKDKLNEKSDGLEASVSLLEITKRIFVGVQFETWVPGQSVTSPFWTNSRDYDVGDWQAVSAEGVPSDQSVVVRYLDDRGYQYEEKFALHPAIWSGRMFPDVDEKKQRRAIEKLSDSIDKYGEAFVKDFTKFLDRTTQPTEEEKCRKQELAEKFERIRRREKRSES